MLYEHENYESILERMIGKVEAWAYKQEMSIDTREGSLIRTALSPAAVELGLMYSRLGEILNESFADTASRRFLILRCAERGIIAYPATGAVWLGKFVWKDAVHDDLRNGAVFFHKENQLNYTVFEKVSESEYKLRCETPGAIGNAESGKLIPISDVPGLKEAELASLLVPGEEEEPTEHLRRRYFDSLNAHAFGGNIADYKEKVNKLQGVGGCKVYPVYYGGGTVRVVIIDSGYEAPEPWFVRDVENILDPKDLKGEKGKGMGIAPIGHKVTVGSVFEKKIPIKMDLTVQKDVVWNDVETEVYEVIDDYFHELAMDWDKVGWEDDPGATLIVRVYHILTRVLAVTGVVDVDGITLDGSTKNIILDKDAIPKKGSVTIVRK